MVILLPYIDYKSSHSSSFLFCTNDCKNGENFPVITNNLLDPQFIHPTVFKIFDILTMWVSSVIRQIFVFALRRLRWRYGRSFSDEFRNMQRNRNIIDSPKWWHVRFVGLQYWYIKHLKNTRPRLLCIKIV